MQSKKKVLFISGSFVALLLPAAIGFSVLSQTSSPMSEKEYKKTVEVEEKSTKVIFEMGQSQAYQEDEDGIKTYQYPIASLEAEDGSSFNLNYFILESNQPIAYSKETYTRSGVLDYISIELPINISGNIGEISTEDLENNQSINYPLSLNADDLKWSNGSFESTMNFDELKDEIADETYAAYTEAHALIHHGLYKKVLMICGSCMAVVLLGSVWLYIRLFKQKKEGEVLNE